MTCPLHDIKLTKVSGLGIRPESFCHECFAEENPQIINDVLWPPKMSGIAIQ